MIDLGSHHNAVVNNLIKMKFEDFLVRGSLKLLVMGYLEKSLH